MVTLISLVPFRPNMQGHRISVFLILIFIISIFPIIEIGENSAETITNSIKWDGVKEINSDVIVKSGAILTIADESIIKINSDISFSVEGTLIIEGTDFSGVQIISNISQQSEQGVQSSWEGINIESSGVAEINGLSLNGARNGIMTKIDSNLKVHNSTISDSIQGILNFGTAEIKDLTCINIQNNCINNQGSTNLVNVFSNNSGQLLKNNNSGTFTNLRSNNTGVVIEMLSNSVGSINNIYANNSGLVIIAYGNQKGISYSGINANYVNKLFDFSNSENLTINDIKGFSVESVLSANSVNSLEISNMEISDLESVGLAIEASTSDTILIRDSIISGYGQSFSFSGGGHFHLDGMTLFSNGKVGQISSSDLTISNGSWEGKSHGLHAQYSSINALNTNISVGENHGTALRILGGTLNVDGNLNLTHEAQWADTTSIGLQLIWSHTIANSINIEGFSTGVSCETTSTTVINSLSITDNTNIGYYQACSESQIGSLNTNFGDYGLYSESGQISITGWTAASHSSSLLFTESTAKTYIRDWEGTEFIFAAEGEADELFFGTTEINDNLILVAGAEKYTETNIEITDLSGTNTLDGIEVSLHNFYDISDINGIVTLPLVNSGSNVYAIDSEQSISRMKILSTNDINPRIELPILPSDGSDWIIDGVNIVLDGFSGELLSDIYITNGGSLTLKESILKTSNVSVELGGILTGTNSKIIADIFVLSSNDIGYEGASLILEGNSSIACEWENMNWYGITLDGNVYFTTSSNCELSLFGGELTGSTIISQGGSIVQFTNLLVTVIDQGEPISSASVRLDGIQENNEIISATTDLTGTANLRAKSIIYNNSGIFEDENMDRIVTMEIGSLEISQINYWDVSENSDMTFVASTVNTEEVSNYLNLDLRWSPYYLFDNLIVSGLIQIENGVDLQISKDKGIYVSGKMNIGSASLHGEDWAGIYVNGGDISFEGSYILNAVQSLVLENNAYGEILDSTFSNSILGHVLLNSGSELRAINSIFELGDDCIKTSYDSEIKIDISNSNISLCGMGIRATGANVNLEDINMYTSNAGMRLIDVSGSLKNIFIDGDFEIFNGLENPPIRIISDKIGIEILDQVNRDLIISNIIIDMQDLGFSIEDSSSFNLNFVEVPKIMFVRSSGLINNLTTNQVSIENTRSSGILELNHIKTDLMTVFGNSGQTCIKLGYGEVKEIIINDLCTDIFSSVIDKINLNTSYYSQSVAHLSNISLITVEELAELVLTYTHNFIAELNGEILEANFELSQENNTQNVLFVGSQSIDIVWKTITSDEIIDMRNATLVTTFNGALPRSDSIFLGPSSNSTLINLEINPPPIVTLIFPDGLKYYSEGLEVTSLGTKNEVNYTISDEHGIDSVSWNLLNMGNNEEIIMFSFSAYNLSELEEGEYLLSIVVIDIYGASTIISEEFIILPSDNDGDNLISCVSDLWWDDLNQRHCGPDLVDKDDDNDGYIDTIDAFPLDSCAYEDTDSDGKPNSIVQSCDTTLILDLDSDGNGILDENEIIFESDDSSSSGGTLVFLLLLILVGGALFRRFKLSEV